VQAASSLVAQPFEATVVVGEQGARCNAQLVAVQTVEGIAELQLRTTRRKLQHPAESRLDRRRDQRLLRAHAAACKRRRCLR
jgi:hypothetical protein